MVAEGEPCGSEGGSRKSPQGGGRRQGQRGAARRGRHRRSLWPRGRGQLEGARGWLECARGCPGAGFRAVPTLALPQGRGHTRPVTGRRGAPLLRGVRRCQARLRTMGNHLEEEVAFGLRLWDLGRSGGRPRSAQSGRRAGTRGQSSVLPWRPAITRPRSTPRPSVWPASVSGDGRGSSCPRCCRRARVAGGGAVPTQTAAVSPRRRPGAGRARPSQRVCLPRSLSRRTSA